MYLPCESSPCFFFIPPPGLDSLHVLGPWRANGSVVCEGTWVWYGVFCSRPARVVQDAAHASRPDRGPRGGGRSRIFRTPRPQLVGSFTPEFLVLLWSSLLRHKSYIHCVLLWWRVHLEPSTTTSSNWLFLVYTGSGRTSTRLAVARRNEDGCRGWLHW